MSPSLPATQQSSVAILLGGLVLASSCRALPRYDFLTTSPHKDCVALRIFMEEAQEAAVYEAIAVTELARLLRLEGKRDIPIYEVRFEFHTRGYPSRQLAYIEATLRHVPEATRQATQPDYRVSSWETFILN